MNEKPLQDLIRMDISTRGGISFRNNIGVAVDTRGVPVRYGLANESKAMNKKLKSGDLIGITPLIITPDMVGKMVGIFTSYEIKRPGWIFSGKGREEAQAAWINLVRQYGGIADFLSERLK